jgi:hypothetical protein
MAEEIRHPDGRIEHPSVRYEPSDAKFGWILGIIIVAIVLAVIIHLALWQFLVHKRAVEDEAKRSNFPLAPGTTTPLPARPRLEQIDRLEGAPGVNASEHEADNLRILNSYGPTSDEGFVRVPIDGAMKYLIEYKKLPARPETPADQRRRSGGLVDAGEPNSGRLFKEAPR